MKYLTAFLLLISIPIAVCGQDTSIVEGYISDAETGEPLPTAHVILSENIGTSADTAGYFSIKGLPTGEYKVSSSFLGYKKFEKTISLQSGERTNLNIPLEPTTFRLEELIVKQQGTSSGQRNIGQANVTPSFLSSLPSIFEDDLLRSLQLLPGIKSSSELSSGLHIRGGSPDQTLILYDQATLYNPSHFFGFYSTFNPSVVGDITLYKGTYPAEYGGRLGSVLSITNRSGNDSELAGELSLGMLATSLSLDGPLANSGSWFISARRSTLEPLLNALNRTYNDIPEKFYFMDATGKIHLNLDSENELSLSFYTGTDLLDFPFSDDANIALNYGNQLISSTWKHSFSDNLLLSANVAGSRYYTFPTFDVATTPYERSNDVYNLGLNVNTTYQPNDQHNILSGIKIENNIIELEDKEEGDLTFNSRNQTSNAAAYVQDNWSITDRMILSPGIRLSHFASGNYFRSAPRLSLEYHHSKSIRLQAAYGRYHQYMTLVSHEAFSGLDVWLSSDEGVPPSSGNQYAVGIKTLPFKGYRLDTEVYYRSMNDLFEPDPFIPDHSGLPYKETFRFGEGYAYGAEFLLERHIGPLTGFVGYTFSVARRRFPDTNRPIAQDGEASFFPTRFDRTHALNLSLQYQFTSQWSVATNFTYTSGKPYTKPIARTFSFRSPLSDRGNHEIVTGKVNGARLPPYHRLDLSISRKGTFFGSGSTELNLQAVNVYSHRNTWFYNFDFNKEPAEYREEVQLLPMLPSISYKINF